MNAIRKIGVDPGFNANKVAEVQGSDVFTYALPSAVGLANRGRKDGLSLAGVVRSRKISRQPFQVMFDGLEYLVGPHVGDFTTPIDRMDFDRFTESSELRATLYTALYRIVNGGSHRLALAIALPVEILQDKDEANRVERSLRSWLVGEHAFSVDGVETVLTITNIRARIPQPVATWFEWGLNTKGQWIKGAEAMRAATLIVDEGYNTLDVLAVEEGRISQRYTGGDTLGMRRASERLIEMLDHRHGLLLELYKANISIQSVVNGQKAAVYLHGKPLDITREVKQVLSSLEVDVVNFIDRAVGRSKEAYQVLLTGGGVLALAPRLQRLFPHATVMYEPVLANARGLAKLAIRPGFLD